MMKVWGANLLIALLLDTRAVWSFRPCSLRTHAVVHNARVRISRSPFATHTRPLFRKTTRAPRNVFQSSVTVTNDAHTNTSHIPIMPASVAVGIVTAAMGFLYGKVLGLSVNTVWKTLPSMLARQGLPSSFNPTKFITGICTFGGLLVGILSLLFRDTFTVANFVSSLSRDPPNKLPSTRIHLLPLLLLSLVTSTFGFSVGPEAPMVCAGGLVGASMARWFAANAGVDGGSTRNDDSNRNEEILAYAGAAGALTAFMGIPIAGSIFALELTRSDAGFQGGDFVAPTVLASVAALVLIRGVLLPSAAVGGHFHYASVGALTGRVAMTTAITCGLGGALVGTLFHKFVSLLKTVAWSVPKQTQTPPNSSSNHKPWKYRELLVKTTIGLLVGILSSRFPQTLFWGEGSLQCMIDGQHTPFSATKHGLGALLTGAAAVDPNLPFATPAQAAQVGLAKLLAIALACAGKFPGGIIFPLFFAAAPLAHACSHLFGGIFGPTPLVVMCLMASVQASVTRTPLATVLILALTASRATELSVMLPACLISSYLGVFFSQWLSRSSYFSYQS